MTKKELLDRVWDKVADEKSLALKEWDHYANIGDFLDAKKYKGAYDALNKIRDFLYTLYKDGELYK